MKPKTKILIVLTALWMLLIFLMSAQSKETSSDVSNNVAAAIVEAMYGNETPHNPEDVGFTGTSPYIFEDLESGLVPKDDIFGRSKFGFKNDVRKLAHIFLYFVLAVFVNSTFISAFGKNKAGYFAVSFGICVLYAALDELHQYFVPGRGAEIKDVALDCAGAFAGSVCVVLIYAVTKLVKTIVNKSKKTA